VSSSLIDFANSFKVESSLFVVEDDTIDQAESLVKYFTCHKLNLYLYDFDFENSDLYNEIDKYIDSLVYSILLSDEVAKAMCFIVNDKNKIITTKYLNDKKKGNLKLSLDAFKKLEEMNFGKIENNEENFNKNHKITQEFVKNQIQTDSNTTVDEIRSMYFNIKKKNATIKNEIDKTSEPTN